MSDIVKAIAGGFAVLAITISIWAALLYTSLNNLRRAVEVRREIGKTFTDCTYTTKDPTLNSWIGSECDPRGKDAK